MNRLCLYYITEKPKDRWLPGDRHVRSIVRRVVRGQRVPSGVDKVFLNLKSGLDRIGANYVVNLPFQKIRDSDHVGILGRGKQCLQGYRAANPIVAGVALMTHPSEWPTLFSDYPVRKYIQHSEWAQEVYSRYYGPKKCDIWPVGIDTEQWSPKSYDKENDILIYDKIRWDRDLFVPGLLEKIQSQLSEKRLRIVTLRYGQYRPDEFLSLLKNSKAMIFLCEHESQGIAYQEALAAGVPIFAWDQGQCLDPNRFQWGDPVIPASSVPYFDDRCGMKFLDIGEFQLKFSAFWDGVTQEQFDPRSYILENLTLERSAQRYLELFES